METSNSLSEQYSLATEHISDRTVSVAEMLPAELWAGIFLDCLTDPLADPFAFTQLTRFSVEITDTRLTPIALAAVCRVWRKVACNLPALWSTCWLSYTYPELNRIWLNRAGTRLLSLHGQCTRNAQQSWKRKDPHEASSAFIGSILPYCCQWKHAILDIGPLVRPHFSSEVSVMSDTFFPFLETLHLYVGYGHTLEILCGLPTPMPAWTPTILSNAPALRELNLGTVAHAAIHLHKIANLTDLEICHTNTAEALIVLGWFPQLQKYSFCIGYHGKMENVPHVLHYSLTHLYLKSFDEIETGDVICALDYVTLPSLSCLHAGDVGHTPFIAFLDRSGCNLTEVKFSGSALSSSGIASILEHPCVDMWLQVLEFEQVRIDSQLLGILQYYPDLSNLIFLEQLSFTKCRFRARDGLLAECIASRCSSEVAEYDESEKGPMERVVQLQKVFISRISNIASYPLDMARIAPLEKPANWVEGCMSGEIHAVVKCDTLPSKRKTTFVKFLLREPESNRCLVHDL